jgi:hypothetical protein
MTLLSLFSLSPQYKPREHFLTAQTVMFCHFLVALVGVYLVLAIPLDPNPGVFHIDGLSGVPVMHVALASDGSVVFLDKVENVTMAKLANGKPSYSVRYDPGTNQYSSLSVSTNPFCSGGCQLKDGTILSVGGNAPLLEIDSTVGDGFKGIRTLPTGATAWLEPNKLSTARWYPTAVVLPSGEVLVCSGSLNGLDPTVSGNNNPTCELLDAAGIPKVGSKRCDLLVNTQPYHMYPFLHVLPEDGRLFVFAGKQSCIVNPSLMTPDFAEFNCQNPIPDLPGMYRTYPNTGSSSMFMLSSKNNWTATILICGGGAYQDITSPTDSTCGRITPNSQNPQWELDVMPEGRTMPDMITLFDGVILILNGANQGAEGFGLATKPTYTALLYRPDKEIGSRFTTAATSLVARLYHSVAIQLPDGRVMVAGSNPHEEPVFTSDVANPFPTEMRVEYYSPYYILGEYAARRPTNVIPSAAIVSTCLKRPDIFTITFNAAPGGREVTVTLTTTGFVTHANHMNQRVIQLDTQGFQPHATKQVVTVTGPPDSNIAPAGVYLLCVLVDGALNDRCVSVQVTC